MKKDLISSAYRPSRLPSPSAAARFLATVMAPATAALAAAAVMLIPAACHKGGRTMNPPSTEVRGVRDAYHGVEVIDPYRWLERWDDPEVRAWSEAQNAYARNYLDRLPAYAGIRARVKEIADSAPVSYRSLAWRPGRLFAVKQQPPLNQPLVVMMPSADEPASEKIVLDLNAFDPAGATSLDWHVPSPDGRLVGVSLSRGGTESGDVHIFEADTGKPLADVIPRVNGGTAGGDMAWSPDGKGFYYTRYPREGERPAEDLGFYQEVWYHELGAPLDEDFHIFGKGLPRISEIRLRMNERTGRLLVAVQEGDSGRFSHFIIVAKGADGREDGERARAGGGEADGGPGGSDAAGDRKGIGRRAGNVGSVGSAAGDARKITDFADGIVEAAWGRADDLYLVSRRDAPRGKILHLAPAASPLEKAETIIQEGADVIASGFGPSLLAVTPARLYVTYQLGGPSEIRAFSLDGSPASKPGAEPLSGVSQVVTLDGDAILFLSSSYVRPPGWYIHDPSQGTPEARKTALFSVSPVDFSDVEAVREFAVSKDGTRIPVDILMPKGISRDGTHPAVLYGYGGFGISMSPRFSALRHIWAERGVIFAVAVIRGGGEYGEDWHRAGALVDKQNVFDDFAAAMEHLIERGYARPGRLAIVGGSNGGLLMGAMITQHPDLFRATVSSVGIYDMLRNELTPNGSFNIPEYGTVKDKTQFEALYAYSPYHRVKAGTTYPAVLFMTGANDPRVDPMHSRKMTARLQAATASGNPILLRTSSTTGHGVGTPLAERIEEDAHEFAFLLHVLSAK